MGDMEAGKAGLKIIKTMRSVVLCFSIVIWVISMVFAIMAYFKVISDVTDSMTVWVMIGSSISMAVVVILAVLLERYSKTVTKLNLVQERENLETTEIMEAICGNYNAVYYCDYLKDEIKIIKFGQTIRKSMPEEFLEKHPLEWYVKIYCDRVIPEQNRQDFLDHVNPGNIREKLKDRMVYTYNYIGTRDGQDNYFQMRAEKVNGSENRFVVGFQDVDSEVHENEQREQVLKNALLEAQKANDVKTDFLSKMSGDLMSPLNRISSSAERIIASGTDASSRAEAEKISVEADKLGGMIDDMLDLNSIRSGDMLVDKMRFDMEKAAEEAEKLCARRAQAKKVTISRDISISDSNVIGDGTKIVEMMKHILFNAIDLSTDGGTISFSVVETQVVNRKATFEISVDHMGKELSARDIDLIFKEDTYEDPAYMGLGITRIMAEMLGGKLLIQDKPEIGNSVNLYITLPIEL